MKHACQQHKPLRRNPLKNVPVSALKRQAGLSLIGILLLISMLLFIGLFAVKVVPGYIEFMTVSSIVEDTRTNPELMKSTKSNVMNSIDAAYRQNNLWDLKAKDTITLTRDRKLGYKVDVAYEKRANLFRNIFVVTEFKNNTDEL